MELELISFKICPFVQRSIITLLYKQTPFKITHIDLTDRPAWFNDISPFGKVPVLRIDNDTILFESAVINEYIDDVTSPRLMPDDPLVRAQNRAWIEFGSACLMDLFAALTVESEEQYTAKQNELAEKLTRLNDDVGDGPYFNGTDPALIDFAFAPLFTRIEYANDHGLLQVLEQCPRVKAWSERLVSLPAVQDSAPEGFASLMDDYLAMRGGYAATKIPAGD